MLDLFNRFTTYPPSQSGRATLRKGCLNPPGSIHDYEDPRLRATLGLIRILDSVSSEEYTIGRGSDCDCVIGGKYNDMISTAI